MHHVALSFFDLENQFAKIYQLNDFLPKLKQLIPMGKLSTHTRTNPSQRMTDTVPDAKTLWLFAEQLKQHGIEQQLFDRF